MSTEHDTTAVEEDDNAMPSQSFRCARTLWKDGQDEAKRRGETLSGAIRRFIMRYIKGLD